jgi:hypothetical protein
MILFMYLFIYLDYVAPNCDKWMTHWTYVEGSGRGLIWGAFVSVFDGVVIKMRQQQELKNSG